LRKRNGGLLNSWGVNLGLQITRKASHNQELVIYIRPNIMTMIEDIVYTAIQEGGGNGGSLRKKKKGRVIYLGEEAICHNRQETGGWENTITS